MDIEKVSSFVSLVKPSVFIHFHSGFVGVKEGGQTLAFWSISPALSEAINLYMSDDHGPLTTEQGEESHCFNPLSPSLYLSSRSI